MKPVIWKKTREVDEAAWTEHERAWLTDEGSLTQRLRAVTHGKIEHRIFQEGLDIPENNECQFLNIPERTETYVREIDWWHASKLWVAARVIIPKETARGHDHPLRTIGKRSLGDILFANPNVDRGDFEFAQLTRAHVLFHRAELYVPKSLSFIWARRSLFYFDEAPLLICEIFLPIVFLSRHPEELCDGSLF